MAEDKCRSKYVFIKTILDPSSAPVFPQGRSIVAEVLRREVGSCVVWAKHGQHDGDGCDHFHAVVRFADQTPWSWLRADLMNADPHSYSAPGRGWQRCVRYLLHLDNPDKVPIPRENLAFRGAISQDEVDMLIGRPRAALINDIRQGAPGRTTFQLVDWLCCERGHSPGEVAQMLRCIVAVNSYLGPIQYADQPIPGVQPLADPRLGDDPPGPPVDDPFGPPDDDLVPPPDLFDL